MCSDSIRETGQSWEGSHFMAEKGLYKRLGESVGALVWNPGLPRLLGVERKSLGVTPDHGLAWSLGILARS